MNEKERLTVEKIVKDINKRWSNESQIGYSELAMNEAIVLGFRAGASLQSQEKVE